MRLDENVKNAMAMVTKVAFEEVGKKNYPVCRVFVQLEDYQEVEPINKTFFLTSDKAIKYFVDVLKDAFNWHGKMENLGNDKSENGIVGFECRVSTEEQISGQDVYYPVQYINSPISKSTISDESKHSLFEKINSFSIGDNKESDETTETTKPTNDNSDGWGDEPSSDVPF